MRILFSALPHYGHVIPLVPLARACADAGHDVTFATGGPLLGRLPVKSVRGYPDRTLEQTEEEVRRRHPELADVPAEEKWRFGLELFADVEYEALRAGVEPLIAELRPDLVVTEPYSVGASAAAVAHGVCTISVGISPWSFIFPITHRTVMERQGIEWPHCILAHGYLDLFPSSTWSNDADTPQPPHRRLLRSVAWSPEDASAPPAWLRESSKNPRAYLTLGTVVFGYTHAMDAALRVLDEQEVDVLAAVGPEGDPTALSNSSDRVRVERFVDQARVIPLVDVVVHHGGSGTALAAMAAGVPQVVMPQGADQFENAKVLSSTGAARAFLPGQPEALLGEHVAAALGDPEMKSAARRLKAEIGRMPLPKELSHQLPDLLALLRT